MIEVGAIDQARYQGGRRARDLASWGPTARLFDAQYSLRHRVWHAATFCFRAGSGAGQRWFARVPGSRGSRRPGWDGDCRCKYLQT